MTGLEAQGSGTRERIETIVIGGGQSGLAVGYYLQRQGRTFAILDANERIGDSWRQRWDSLRVFTPARLDGLPGMPFPAPGSSFPTKDAVADYLEAYAARFDLPVRNGIQVDGLSRFEDRFIVTCGNHRIEADNVVVAQGAYQQRQGPLVRGGARPGDRAGTLQRVPEPDSAARGRRPHRRCAATRGRNRTRGVPPSPDLAVGQGHGARTGPSRRWGGQADHPADVVCRHARADGEDPVGRRVQRTFRARGIPLARVRRNDLTAAGVQLVPRTAGVQDGLPVLADGRVLNVANVIWCTGFTPDLRWIDLPVCNQEADPVHERGVVTSEPGLYFIGMYFLYALSSVLIGGVGRDAEHIARHIGARQTVSRPRPHETSTRMTEGAPSDRRTGFPRPTNHSATGRLAGLRQDARRPHPLTVAAIRDADLPVGTDAVARLWLDYLDWGDDGLQARYGFRLPVQEAVERDLASIGRFLPTRSSASGSGGGR